MPPIENKRQGAMVAKTGPRESGGTIRRERLRASGTDGSSRKRCAHLRLEVQAFGRSVGRRRCALRRWACGARRPVARFIRRIYTAKKRRSRPTSSTLESFSTPPPTPHDKFINVLYPLQHRTQGVRSVNNWESFIRQAQIVWESRQLLCARARGSGLRSGQSWTGVRGIADAEAGMRAVGGLRDRRGGLREGYILQAQWTANALNQRARPISTFGAAKFI